MQAAVAAAAELWSEEADLGDDDQLKKALSAKVIRRAFWRARQDLLIDRRGIDPTGARFCGSDERDFRFQQRDARVDPVTLGAQYSSESAVLNLLACLRPDALARGGAGDDPGLNMARRLDGDNSATGPSFLPRGPADLMSVFERVEKLCETSRLLAPVRDAFKYVLEVRRQDFGMDNLEPLVSFDVSRRIIHESAASAPRWPTVSRILYDIVGARDVAPEVPQRVAVGAARIAVPPRFLAVGDESGLSDVALAMDLSGLSNHPGEKMLFRLEAVVWKREESDYGWMRYDPKDGFRSGDGRVTKDEADTAHHATRVLAGQEARPVAALYSLQDADAVIGRCLGDATLTRFGAMAKERVATQGAVKVTRADTMKTVLVATLQSRRAAHLADALIAQDAPALDGESVHLAVCAAREHAGRLVNLAVNPRVGWPNDGGQMRWKTCFMAIACLPLEARMRVLAEDRLQMPAEALAMLRSARL